MNFEDEIAKTMSEEITKEIDFEILSGMLVSLGWKKVTLTRFFSRKHSINILMWCEENIKHPFEHFGSTFVFQDQGDAVNFTLKWL
jgi:hypothetical protein